jgi:hypothetical protein
VASWKRAHGEALIRLEKADQFEARFRVELGGRQGDICGFDLPVAAVDSAGLTGVGRGSAACIDGDGLCRSNESGNTSGEHANQERAQRIAE